MIDRNAFRAVLKNGHEIIAYIQAQDTELLSCTVGDFVMIEVSPYDMSKGRLVNKNGTEQ